MNENNKKQLPLGLSDFKKLIEGDYYYVDKSHFIKECVETSGETLLVPRPRRFGKTLNLSMLRYYFEKLPSGLNNLHLFKGLKIESSEGKHQKWAGEYPVIFISFKDCKKETWEETLVQIKFEVSALYGEHQYLLQSQNLDNKDIKYFDSILNSTLVNDSEYEFSLYNLSYYLNKHWNKNPIILIDEYDTAIHQAYAGGFYKKTVDFFKTLLSKALKDNLFLHKAVVTGILRVAKESIFSGLNNLQPCPLHESSFSTCFGLLQEEVDNLLAVYGHSDKKDLVKLWYNGYQFGRQTIYNPWSLISLLSKPDFECKPYWLHTAQNTLIEKLVTNSGTILKDKMDALLNGHDIDVIVEDNVVFADLELRDDLVWSFLLFTGYLKYTKITKNIFEEQVFSLAIPNQEIRMMFTRLVKNWFSSRISESRVTSLLKALTNGDMLEFETILKEFVLASFSYIDVSKVASESVYQAFCLGLFVNLSADYEVTSNRESGYGRYDVLLKPRDKRKLGLVLEFKKIPKNKTPNVVLDEALAQINKKKYDVELKNSGVTNILKIAVAFAGKDVYLKSEGGG